MKGKGIDFRGFSHAKLSAIWPYFPAVYGALDRVAGRRLRWPRVVRRMTEAEVREGRARGKGHGLYYSGGRRPPEIALDGAMSPRDLLLNLIHENLHHAFPRASEEEINGRLLPRAWRLATGERRVGRWATGTPWVKANPWLATAQPQAELGRVVVHVARKSSQAGRTFSRRQLFDLVGALAENASVVAQVGITGRWGRESSAQVVLVNGGPWAIRWREFERRAREVAVDLAAALWQDEVLVEFFAPRGYSAEIYATSHAYSRRRRIARRVAST